MNIYLIERSEKFESEENSAYLRIDSWSDFSFITMFSLLFCDEKNAYIKLAW